MTYRTSGFVRLQAPQRRPGRGLNPGASLEVASPGGSPVGCMLEARDSAAQVLIGRSIDADGRDTTDPKKIATSGPCAGCASADPCHPHGWPTPDSSCARTKPPERLSYVAAALFPRAAHHDDSLLDAMLRGPGIENLRECLGRMAERLVVQQRCRHWLPDNMT